MDEQSELEQSVPMNDETNSKNKNKLRISLDYRFIVAALLMVIVGMVIAWKPWMQAKVSDRTVDVTGEATLQATPDEYVFMPNYDFTNADKQTALNALTKQSNIIIAKLKSLGVTDKQIKTDSMAGEPYFSYVTNGRNTSTYTLQLMVTLDSSKLAQEVQDYLATTSPSGAVSPQLNFSDSKQKSLNNQARDIATKNARAKAEQSAKNLGFKLGAVKSVSDSVGFKDPISQGVAATGSPTSDGSAKQPSLTVQPGQNKLDYSVDVVYFIH